MNERITELAKQATKTIRDWDNSYTFFDQEKFAELIVRECTKLSYLEDSGNPEVEAALEFWRRASFNHFGFKE